MNREQGGNDVDQAQNHQERDQQEVNDQDGHQARGGQKNLVRLFLFPEGKVEVELEPIQVQVDDRVHVIEHVVEIFGLAVDQLEAVHRPEAVSTDQYAAS